MGVSAVPVRSSVRDRLPAWTASPALLRRLALASLAGNVLIVVTGGAVRLTNSGLGCPTWPRCSGASLVVTSKQGGHGAIEFANRSLTIVLTVLLAATLLIAWRQRTEQQLALIGLLGIPAQAVLGGVVVLTDLNPWVVALHFLLSMALIAVTVLLYLRLLDVRPCLVTPAALWLTRTLLLAAALVLAFGTVVTGTGPHAGDLDNTGRLHRIGLSPSGAAQLHADAVMVLIGLTVGLIALLYSLGESAIAACKATVVLLGVELAQGIIGYTQYFLHVPALLVGFHMFGACLVWVAALVAAFRIHARWARAEGG